ncbi:hypothetical protein CTEN210_14041 [Chaetoceros tenuissimus]|uniref:Helicase-associated domain-containing protein n=1 Tax=Chaetoceros tenuissimus TaxID=426638 RepID=A0AAD3D6R3_9STRA|nr:hypothetical protein CTEN210_14041 [Chaetoceros tenuissimus]
MENTDKSVETAPVAPGAETSTETEAHVEHTILASEVQPPTLDEQNQALDETAAAVVEELALDADQMEAMATEPTPVAVEAPKQMFYALRKGKSANGCLYMQEQDLLDQIQDYPEAEYKICERLDEAYAFISGADSEASSSTPVPTNAANVTITKPDAPAVQDSVMTEEDGIDEAWEAAFKELSAFVEKYGTCDVPYYHRTLGQFVAQQRLEYKAHCNQQKTSLTQGKIEKLKSINFYFGGHKDRKTFAAYVEELERYRLKNGGKNPPYGTQLAKWIGTMQKRYEDYKKGNSVYGMDTLRVDRLERLGFEWTENSSETAAHNGEAVETVEESTGTETQDTPAAPDANMTEAAASTATVPPVPPLGTATELPPLTEGNSEPTTRPVNPTETTTTAVLNSPPPLAAPPAKRRRSIDFFMGDNFDIMFKEFEEYKKKTGSVIPPVQPVTKLRQWVDRVRLEYKRIETGGSLITTAQVQRLHDVGFQFDRKIKPRTWEERFNELKRFKEQFGHCKVPRLFSQPSYEGLGKWVADQRMKRNYMLKGKKSNMTEERAARLTEIGMIWSVFKLPPKEERVERKPWQHRFESLLEFKAKHGHTTVPQAFPVLGQWCHSQRVNYKLLKQGRKSAMTQEQASKLLEIGFTFEVMPRKNKKEVTQSLGNPYPHLPLITDKNEAGALQSTHGIDLKVEDESKEAESEKSTEDVATTNITI